MANSKSIGVAYSDQAISGGTLDGTPIGATTPSTGAFTTLSASGNVALGDSALDTIGMYGATAVVQASAITAISTSAPTTAAFGFTTTQATAIIAGLNSVILALHNVGITA